MKSLTNLKFLAITILITLSHSKLIKSSGMITTCPTTNLNHNQTSKLGIYKTNLLNLLTNFSSSASTLSFHNSSFGESSDKLYGLYVCRGDATPKLCHSCLVNLTTWIIDNTAEGSTCKDGFGFWDDCMLHYANYSSFGKAKSRLLGSVSTLENATSVEFNKTLTGMVGRLILDAAFKSKGLFATREAVIGGGDGTVYGLAQCTPNIGREKCSACLKIGLLELEKCCGDLMEAWFMLSNCQLRYSNISFYKVKVEVKVEPPTAPTYYSSGELAQVSQDFLFGVWSLLLVSLACCFGFLATC